MSSGKKVGYYTPEDEALLRRVWPTATTAEMRAHFPNRTQCALMQKARAMGLTFKDSRSRKANLTPLLNDTIETWYWLGFILADGYLSHRGELSITVNAQDERHLSKLATMLNGKVKNLKRCKTELGNDRNHVRFAAMNPEVIEALKIKLGLTSSRKTEIPPNIDVLEKIDPDFVAAMFIGFFDGDGCMRAKGYGQIVCHKAWITVFRFFESRGFLQSVRLGYRCHATMPVSVATKLKHFPVPKLQRKWIKAK